MFPIVNSTASSITNTRFGKADKAKLNRKEYHDIIKAVYLLAQTNTLKDVRESINKGRAQDIDLDLLLHVTLDENIVNSHNMLVNKTKYGKIAFREMEMEDLLYDKPLDKLFIPDGQQTMKGMR